MARKTANSSPIFTFKNQRSYFTYYRPYNFKQSLIAAGEVNSFVTDYKKTITTLQQYFFYIKKYNHKMPLYLMSVMSDVFKNSSVFFSIFSQFFLIFFVFSSIACYVRSKILLFKTTSMWKNIYFILCISFLLNQLFFCNFFVIFFL